MNSLVSYMYLLLLDKVFFLFLLQLNLSFWDHLWPLPFLTVYLNDSDNDDDDDDEDQQKTQVKCKVSFFMQLTSVSMVISTHSKVPSSSSDEMMTEGEKWRERSSSDQSLIVPSSSSSQ